MHAEKFPMLTDVSTPTFPRTNNNHSSVRSRRGARSGYLDLLDIQRAVRGSQRAGRCDD